MMDKVYVVTDIGYGDGGKGSIIHSLVSKVKPSIVIKRGGAQGSHSVTTSFGENFKFSQWGCGTLDGVPTYLSNQMVIAPIGIENECNELKRLGIYNPYRMLSVHPDCICTTPLHTISSQLEELKLRDNPRGTIGSGVGRAYRMHSQFGADMTIYASELRDRDIVHKKLLRQLEYYREEYKEPFECNESDRSLISSNLGLLVDDEFLRYIEDEFIGIGKELCLEGFDEVLKLPGSAIVECSHGVLTDSEIGFKPHVSAIRTLPKFTNEMFKDVGYNGDIINLAVHRAYEVRHGAGPIPTYDTEFTKRIIKDPKSSENRWQGSIRAGVLDLRMMRYAIAESGVDYDGLCLTCFDQILGDDRVWRLCVDYNEPVISISIKDHIHKNDLFNIVDNVIKSYLGLSLYILSLGSNERQKVFVS